MSDIKLEGDGFSYHMVAMKCVQDDAKELRALLSYRSKTMIKLNKNRALSDIDCSIENLQELRAAIEKI